VDYFEILTNRRAIRKYQRKPVAKEKIEEIFKSILWTPVANFLRVTEFYVIKEDKRDQVVQLISQNTTHLRDLLMLADEVTRQKALDFYPDLGGAPTIVFLTIPHSDDPWERKWFLADAFLSVMIFLQAAYSQGLGSCGVTLAPWVEKEVKEVIEISDDKEIVCALTLGYPAEDPEPLPRNPYKVHYL
jgi:nitroreductase